MPDALADLIKQRRAELGMTQSRLGELVGKSASAVRSWERGRAAPKDHTTRAALAAVLGISDDELNAAIDGADISFFSDPGRPIASDPTPTIVQPLVEPAPASASEARDVREPVSETDGEAVESESEDGSPSELGSDEADAEADAEAGAEADTDAEAAGAAPSGEGRLDPEGSESEPESSGSGDEVAESEIESEETAPELGGASKPETEQRASGVSESDLDVPGELVGVGAGIPLGESEGAATRLVERRPSTSLPAAILAPAPTVEPDPVSQDAWLYRRRMMLLAAMTVALLVVLRWALAGAGDAISEVLDNLRTGL